MTAEETKAYVEALNKVIKRAHDLYVNWEYQALYGDPARAAELREMYLAHWDHLERAQRQLSAN